MARKKTANQIYVLSIGLNDFALPPDAPLTTILDAFQRAIAVERDYDTVTRAGGPEWKRDHNRPRVELTLVPADKFRLDQDDEDAEDDETIYARSTPVGNGRDLVIARTRVNGHGPRRLFAEE